MNNVKKYNIAGYIIASTIPDILLRSNFNEYEILDDSRCDIFISINYINDEKEDRIFIDVDNYRYYSYKNNNHTYMYKNNVYVSKCIVLFKENMEAEAKIVLKNEVSYADIAKREITYAFRDALYTYLIVNKALCLHSCGFIDNGKGILISGEPGSGKSTLVKKYALSNNITIVGDDINVCKFSCKPTFFGTPCCRINNNLKNEIHIIIFLGNEDKNLDAEDIYELLLTNEFCMKWIPNVDVILKNISQILYEKTMSFMIKNEKNIDTYLNLERRIKEIING